MSAPASSAMDNGSGDGIRWSLIAAADRNGVIGIVDAAGQRLPWHLPDDLRHFKRVTMGCPVLMGRRTWQSIGRPLPDRTNVVLTRDAGFAADGAVVAGDPAAARQAVRDALRSAGAAAPREAFVIGGAEVFAHFLPDADRLHLTEIDHAFDGNCVFAPFARGAPARAGWREIERRRQDSGQGFNYDFVVYERPRAPGDGFTSPEHRHV